MTTGTRFPVSKTVGLYRAEEKVTGLGDIVPGYSAEPEQIRVFGWYVTGGQDTDSNGNVFQVAWDIVLYAPLVLGIGSHDRVDIPGVGVCDVVASPGDWSANPWWDSGLSEIKLRRVDHE